MSFPPWWSREARQPVVNVASLLVHRVPGVETRWDAHAHLAELGCPLWTHRLYIGPDGLWRGSGVEVAG